MYKLGVCAQEHQKCQQYLSASLTIVRPQAYNFTGATEPNLTLDVLSRPRTSEMLAVTPICQQTKMAYILQVCFT